MKFNANVNKVDTETIEAGDLVLLENGDKVLIVLDYDEEDFRGVNLVTSILTNYCCTPQGVLRELDSKVIKIVKAENITMGWD